jgi:hypothetical protein
VNTFLWRPAATPDRRTSHRKPALKGILGGEFTEGDRITVDYAGGEYSFERASVPEPVTAGVEA